MSGPIPVPNLNLNDTENQHSSAGLSSRDNAWSFGNDWVVNVPVSRQGAGLSLQGGAGSGMSMAMIGIAIVLGGLLVFRRKKG
jgi:hypothetical protein